MLQEPGRSRGVCGIQEHCANGRQNTQINRYSLADLPSVLETAIALGAHAWQIMLTVAMGRAADSPEILLQPYEMLDLFPRLAELKARCDAAGVRLLPGNN